MVSTNFREDGYVEYIGLSTDLKPLNQHNGSVFLEMDTAAVFIFDESRNM